METDFTALVLGAMPGAGELAGRIKPERVNYFLSMLLAQPISVMDPSSERTFQAVLDLGKARNTCKNLPLQPDLRC